MKSKDTIIKQIQALFAKAERTDSIKEKDEAMRIAQTMLQKYNMDIEVIRSIKEEGGDKIEEDFVTYDDQYQRALLDGIALNNFCDSISHKKPDWDAEKSKWCYVTQVSIIGKPHNVAAVIFLYKFYQNEILQLAIKDYLLFAESKGIDAKDAEKMFKAQKKKFIADFVNGAVRGVLDALREQKRQAMASSEALTSLVLFNDKDVELYVKEKYPKLTTSKAWSPDRGNAFDRGYKAGQGIKPYNSVEGTGTKTGGNKLLS